MREELLYIRNALYFLFKQKKLHTVTAFLGSLGNVKSRVRVTRVAKHGSFTVVIGKPNYEEREFLKLCRKAKSRPRRYRLYYFKDRKGKIAKSQAE